jgi:hypothetical protein
VKYESLVQMLSQRLRTAIEVSGAEGLVSIARLDVADALTDCPSQNYAETLQRPLKTYRLSFNIGASTDDPDSDTVISYSKTE